MDITNLTSDCLSIQGAREHISETEQSDIVELKEVGIWSSDPFHVIYFHEKLRIKILGKYVHIYFFDNCYNIYVHQVMTDLYLGSKIIGGYGYFSNWICRSAVLNEQPLWSEQPDRLVTIFSPMVKFAFFS